jgi:hypothetical protein
MKALTRSVIFSRREKLLLGLLGSAMLFSFSFSYGAVNQAKVDSIMQTINTAANNFSSQSDRDAYYQRVYTGLSDAIGMLAVVRDNVGAMIGTAPVDMPPNPPTPPIPSATDSRMGSCKTTAYAWSYSSAAKIDCSQAHDSDPTGSAGYGSLGTLLCSVTHTTPIGTMGIKPVSKGDGNFVIEYKPGTRAVGGMATSKYWTFTFNAQTPGIGQADTRVAKLEVAISSQPNDFTSSNVIQKGTSVYRTDQWLLTYREFSPWLIMPWNYPHTLYINVRPLTYHDMTKGTSYADEEITATQVASRGLSLPTQSFYLIPNPLPWTSADGPNGANANLDWKTLIFKEANYCLAGMSGSTTWGPSPIQVVNPIANYPIPEPCGSGVKIQKEIMGKSFWGWKKVPYDKWTYPDGVIFRLRIDSAPEGSLGSIDWDPNWGFGASFSSIKISPYPCDFAKQEESKIGCLNPQYTVGKSFLSTTGKCELQKWVIYYVNIKANPRVTDSTEHHTGITWIKTSCNRSNVPCGFNIMDRWPIPASLPYWGIYNSYEEYAIYKEKRNDSPENAETLRQKVVSDYKTKGMNTDGLTASLPSGGVTSPRSPMSSIIPFVNNCPAGIQPSAGWDIRNNTMGFALSVGNLLEAPKGKPIVVAINVPAGYTTKTATTNPPSMLIWQAQAGYSEGPVTVDFSTNPCVKKSTEGTGLNGVAHMIYTPDDSRKTTWANPIVLIPGQVNYISIWDAGEGFGTLQDQGKFGVNISFKNWQPSAWGNSDASIPGHPIISSNLFGKFIPGMPQDFPTGSTPHTPNIWGSSGGSTTPPVSTTPPSTRVWPWENMENIFCPDTLANAQSAYPNTKDGAGNSYWWNNIVPGTGGATSNAWWNLKNRSNLTDESLPATCTTGKEFIKHTTSYHCDRYVCRN